MRRGHGHRPATTVAQRRHGAVRRVDDHLLQPTLVKPGGRCVGRREQAVNGPPDRIRGYRHAGRVHAVIAIDDDERYDVRKGAQDFFHRCVQR